MPHARRRLVAPSWATRGAARPSRGPDFPRDAFIRTSVTFVQRDGRTEMTVRQRVLPPELAASAAVLRERKMATEGWAEALERLESLVESGDVRDADV